MTKPKPKDQLQKRGRKSLLRPEYIRIAEVAAKFGATEEEIARELGVPRSTLNNWKYHYPEFLDALKLAKEVADARVEHALYQRAIGYQHEAEKIMTVALGDNKGSKVVREKYIERYPPDTASICFWLKNRQLEKWRDVQRIDSAVGHYVLSDHPMTVDEWIRERTIADGGETKTIEHEPDK